MTDCNGSTISVGDFLTRPNDPEGRFIRVIGFCGGDAIGQSGLVFNQGFIDKPGLSIDRRPLVEINEATA